jgi:hypothetical protein
MPQGPDVPGPRVAGGRMHPGQNETRPEADMFKNTRCEYLFNNLDIRAAQTRSAVPNL